MKRDVSFNGVSRQFLDEIYGTSKGYVRLNVLWHDLVTEIPELLGGGLRILDAGGGDGRVSRRLVRQGNRVVLCDSSEDMLDEAKKWIGYDSVENSVDLVRSEIQELPARVGDQFDVVMCHAVLEWLARPEDCIAALSRLLKADGRLSLMFYNRNASILKRALAGEFLAAARESTEEPSPRGYKEGAIPLREQMVTRWLRKVGIEVISKAGIRIFHDHLPPSLKGESGLEELLELEKGLRKHEPFASLGQHIHLVCRPS